MKHLCTALVIAAFGLESSPLLAQPKKPTWETAIEALGGRVYPGPVGGKMVAFSKTNVADADLRILKDVPDLQVLHLGDTNITDAGLEHLKNVPSLKEVELRHTHVTEAGANALKKARPGLVVTYKTLATGLQIVPLLLTLLITLPMMGVGVWFMLYAVRTRNGPTGIFPARTFLLGLALVVTGLVLGTIGIMQSFGSRINLSNLF